MQNAQNSTSITTFCEKGWKYKPIDTLMTIMVYKTVKLKSKTEKHLAASQTTKTVHCRQYARTELSEYC